MLCLNCNKNEVEPDKTYGFLPCTDCQERQSLLTRPRAATEITTEEIKEGRKAYFDDIHGAHRQGVPSKEFRDRWGVAAMKRQGFTDKEIRNAKPVWTGDDTYYKTDN